jgi:YgiT-type zinc finger domain-containing protein
MTDEPTSKNERCAVCGGEVHAATITHEEKRAGQIYLFEHVPVQVCSACAEIWIADSTLRQIDQLIHEGTPVRTVQTPVYEFAPSATR